MAIIIPAILIAVWDFIKSGAEKLFEIAKVVLNFMKDAFSWFIQVSPKPVKIMLFLFFILFLSNSIIGFFVGLNFVCDDDSNLRQYDGLTSGVGAYFAKGMSENLTGNLSQYQLDRSSPVIINDEESAESILYVKCFGADDPHLSFFGIKFLDYKIWVVLILIGILTSIGIKAEMMRK